MCTKELVGIPPGAKITYENEKILVYERVIEKETKVIYKDYQESYQELSEHQQRIKVEKVCQDMIDKERENHQK